MGKDELGSIGEFLSSVGVLITLVFLYFETRRNNKILLRQNAKQTARDDVNALQSLLAEDVSELFMRGNTEGLAALTPHERYRYDIGYVIWLHTIEEAYLDFNAGFYPEESMTPWKNSVSGFLTSPGGSVWWNERRYWFTEEFRTVVDQLLSEDNPEASFSGQVPRNAGGT